MNLKLRKGMIVSLAGLSLFGIINYSSVNSSKADAKNNSVQVAKKTIRKSKKNKGYFNDEMIEYPTNENMGIVAQQNEEVKTVQKEENKDEQTVENNQTTSNQQIYQKQTTYIVDGICEKDGNVDNYWISKVNQQLKYVPNYLIELFKNEGWHIYVTDKNIAQTFYAGQYNSVKGTTNPDEKKIYLEDRENAMSATLHEFGHFFDMYHGWISDSEEFYNIYNSETDAFKRTVNVTFHYDNNEMFAEAFKVYLTNKSKLANGCPQLFNFINKYF